MPRTLLGVAGFPVAHSRSPAMHNAALAEMGLDWLYVPLPLPPERFAETVRALPASGFRGVNVTVPHKLAAYGMADEHTTAAAAIGAANTLSFTDGRIIAENFVTATSGTGTRGTFEFTVPFEVNFDGVGTLIVFEASAKDGSRINLVEIPLRMKR